MLLHLACSKLNAKAVDFIQKSGVAFAQPQAAGTVCSLLYVKVKGQGKEQTLAILFELVSKLLCCAYAIIALNIKAC